MLRRPVPTSSQRELPNSWVTNSSVPKQPDLLDEVFQNERNQAEFSKAVTAFLKRGDGGTLTNQEAQSMWAAAIALLKDPRSQEFHAELVKLRDGLAKQLSAPGSAAVDYALDTLAVAISKTTEDAKRIDGQAQNEQVLAQDVERLGRVAFELDGSKDQKSLVQEGRWESLADQAKLLIDGTQAVLSQGLNGLTWNAAPSAGLLAGIKKGTFQQSTSIQTERNVWHGDRYFSSIDVIKVADSKLAVTPPEAADQRSRFPSSQAIARALAKLPPAVLGSFDEIKLKADGDPAQAKLSVSERVLYVGPQSDGEFNDNATPEALCQVVGRDLALGQLGAASAGTGWLTGDEKGFDPRLASWQHAAYLDGKLDPKSAESPVDDFAKFWAAFAQLPVDKQGNPRQSDVVALAQASPSRYTLTERLYNLAPTHDSDAKLSGTVPSLPVRRPPAEGSLSETPTGGTLAIDGREVTLKFVRSPRGPNEPATVDKKRMQILAQAFARLPDMGRSAISELRLSEAPGGVGYDEETLAWYEEKDRSVTTFPRRKGDLASVYSDLLHESGHAVAYKLFSPSGKDGFGDATWAPDDDRAFSVRWLNAVEEDQHNVSQYGLTAPAEDFAETWTAYWRAKDQGEGAFEKARKKFPNRFLVIDGLVSRGADRSLALHQP